MRVVYSITIFFFAFLLRVAALFNVKARQWVNGRRDLFARLEAALKEAGAPGSRVVWFHVSSLGEFEQGLPVMEATKKRWPQKKILLTFFSPSGYEIRKTHPAADLVFYLPADTPANAGRFLDDVRPEAVFFVKYDFWFNYMKAIHDRGIPLYFISALFREGQPFFRWYGGWFRRQLGHVSYFFVQDRASADLLAAAGITRVTLAGDTRFDRVHEIAGRSEGIPQVERFCNGRQTMVIGSSWEPDEEIVLPLINAGTAGLKFIIAPHDTSQARIRYILDRINVPAVRLSALDDDETAAGAAVLVIDSVGILSRLYRYAAVAYIGGGFGKGIHNIQEAITFGVPVIFGPNYRKFREALDLVALGGAFSVASAGELDAIVKKITGDPGEHEQLTRICREYVDTHRGATERIMGFLDGT